MRLLLLYVTCRTGWLDCGDLLYSLAPNACDCGLVQDLLGRLVALLDSDLELWTRVLEARYIDDDLATLHAYALDRGCSSTSLGGE